MALDTWLSTLEIAGLIQQIQADPELEYLFRHALIQQAAYDSLLRTDRKVLHRQVGEALEATYAGRLQEVAPILGHHYLSAGEDCRACEFLTLAGEQAAGQYALTEAVMHYDAALEAAQRCGAALGGLYRARGQLHETLGHFDLAQDDYLLALQHARQQEELHTAWQVLLDLGFLWAGRDYQQAGEYYRQAHQLAQALADPADLAHTLNRIGNWHLNLDHPVQALTYHRQALEIFEQSGNLPGVAETLDLLGMAYSLSGDMLTGADHYHRAIALFRQFNNQRGLASTLATLMVLTDTCQADILVSAISLADAVAGGEEALESARRMGWKAGESFALFGLAACFLGQGDYGRAYQSAQASLQTAQEIGHLQWMTAAYCILGMWRHDLLDWPAARADLEKALALAGQIGSLHWQHTAGGFLALVYISAGDLEKAERLLQRLIPQDSLPRAPATIGQWLDWYALADLRLAQGRAAEAMQLVERLSATIPHGGPHPERIVLRLARLRAATLVALEQLDEAEQVLQDVLPVVVARGVRPALWRIYAELGKIYGMRRQQPEAQQAFGQALGIVQELAATVPDPALRKHFVHWATKEFV
jgi:tetratricopeptide (TPR) repeat protein